MWTPAARAVLFVLILASLMPSYPAGLVQETLVCVFDPRGEGAAGGPYWTHESVAPVGWSFQLRVRYLGLLSARLKMDCVSGKCFGAPILIFFETSTKDPPPLLSKPTLRAIRTVLETFLRTSYTTHKRRPTPGTTPPTSSDSLLTHSLPLSDPDRTALALMHLTILQTLCLAQDPRSFMSNVRALNRELLAAVEILRPDDIARGEVERWRITDAELREPGVDGDGGAARALECKVRMCAAAEALFRVIGEEAPGDDDGGHEAGEGGKCEIEVRKM
ncbi:hypothetical protein BDK51DRAFT_39131 [Blyttiomyces helicus]|uniref:Uncharacterized protein n=1 Tax=Blyttiomyces helicus TaxID=388810 RepID=A0A4P9WCX2_9FUNG|nr:hypothetical protein BDK51DRAFT_39131 [Blyttiomyces helicus]|eukprot:RKO89473.1 hypothetical protein BDK51DRAFT_39131 [Blyttiomyces helicus]